MRWLLKSFTYFSRSSMRIGVSELPRLSITCQSRGTATPSYCTASTNIFMTSCPNFHSVRASMIFFLPILPIIGIITLAISSSLNSYSFRNLWILLYLELSSAVEINALANSAKFTVLTLSKASNIPAKNPILALLLFNSLPSWFCNISNSLDIFCSNWRWSSLSFLSPIVILTDC